MRIQDRKLTLINLKRKHSFYEQINHDLSHQSGLTVMVVVLMELIESFFKVSFLFINFSMVQRRHVLFYICCIILCRHKYINIVIFNSCLLDLISLISFIVSTILLILNLLDHKSLNWLLSSYSNHFCKFKSILQTACIWLC